ncbi:MAG: sigma-70 family RNA polymerase sigma factor [Clostridia bacterium]
MSDEQWLEQIWREHYKLLYDTGRYTLQGQPERMDRLYDDIQNAFLALWNKREKLKNHPNIGGWLVCALRLQLKTSAGKVYRDASHRAYSIDDENAPSLEDTQQSVDADLLAEDKRTALKEVLGEENAVLFLAYTLGNQTAKELAAKYGMSEASIWVRISRIKKKLLGHPEIFYVFLLAMLGLGK